ncbi:MAG: MBL fold metallo-hydrolase [Bacteroidales bacterium]|jgi:glyoxylase-like metal-dependent hydrolase (beta-lactamase superfamily II)|nr:MBL fold metallo-hydrolase [Bacteroidales bacterium]
MEIFKLVFSPIEVNTYILADEHGKCAVIDCACYNRSEFVRFTGLLEQKKLEPVLLLNTHCHLDHIFGNGMFLAKYNLGAYCHKDEEANRRDSVLHAELFGLKMETPPEPAGLINDYQTVTFGSVTLMALHVPGHSPGSLAFYCKDDNVVFTGDALFSGSIGRTDLPGGNFETLIHSIQSKLFTLPPATIVYPGHGEETTIETEMATNPYFK